MKILFVGNSFTYVNDLPETLRRLAAANGMEWETVMVARGGWYLSRFAFNDDEPAARLRETYARGGWDYIVLQDQSFNPAGNPEDFRKGARALRKMMPMGRLIMYQTWAYADGSENLTGVGMDYATMRDKLAESYQAMAEELGGQTARVGSAFSLCRAVEPEINLYSEDGKHPSPAGTYLAACVFYECIAGRAPGADGEMEGLDAATKQKLRRVAAACGASAD